MQPSAALSVSTRLTARGRSLIAGRIMESDAQLSALLNASAALTAAGVPHALIGGLAVGVRSGQPRATMDIDFAITTTDVLAPIVAVMTAAGFDHRGTHAHSINFRSSVGEPVQLAFDSRFDPAIARAEAVAVGDRAVPVVLGADLIEMKQWAAADPSRRRSKALRDQADIELLRGDIADLDEGW